MFNGIIDEKQLNKQSLFSLVILSGFFFFMVIAELSNSFDNAQYVASLELAVVFSYLFSFKDIQSLVTAINTEKNNIALFILWALSVVYSFFYSYPDAIEFYLALSRLYQTLMHVLFFIVCWSLIAQREINIKAVFVVIAFTSLVVILGYIWHGFQFPFIGSSEWFNNPPFNSHIRHSGYQVVAAIAFYLVLFVEKDKSKLKYLVKFVVLCLLFLLLFWLGGRGAILSVLGVILFYVTVAKIKDILSLRYIATIICAMSIGLLLSELLVLYNWNGVTGSLGRSVNVVTINQLSSNRLDIWAQTWGVYKSHIFWGLGPQGFLGITTFKTIVHPHNVFLQFLIEWGLVGSVLFFILLVRGFYAGLMKNVIQVKKINMVMLGGGGVIVALSLHALTDGTYYHPQPSAYLAFSYALWLQTPFVTRNEV